MIIIHGDNHVLVHNKLTEIIADAKTKNQKITRLEAKSLTPASLEEALGSDSLFGEEKLIVIEELHSLPTSKKKKELVEQIATSANSALVLYEKKKLTVVMLKKFPGARVFEFKITNSLWQLLDFLGSADKTKTLKLLHQAVSQNDAFFVFTMICRQIRMLIEAKDGGTLVGAPFMITKLKNQARQFSLPQLLDLHTALFQIDLKQKTSTSALSLAQELDLLLIKM